MSEFGDHEPSSYSSHNFSEQRRSYQSFARARAREAEQKAEPMENLVPELVTIDCKWPLILGNDVTGSLGREWIATQFSKFPYLHVAGKVFMGQDQKILYGAIGDSNGNTLGSRGDKYFLQVLEEATDGGNAEEEIKKLIPEGGGGGQGMEDYQLFVLYALHNIKSPKANRKPLLILNGDEAPYESVKPELAKRVYVELDEEISTDEIFRLAKEKFTIYMVRKSYGNYTEREIHNRWVELLGDSHVCVLQDPNRVVDVYFGIMAKEARMIKEFEEEIKFRQTEEQCDEVFETLEPIFADPTPDYLPVETESDEGEDTAPLI